MPFPGRPKSSSTLQSQSTNVRRKEGPAVRGSVSLTFSSHTPALEQQHDRDEFAHMKTTEQTWPRRSAPTYHIRSGSQPYLTDASDRRASVGPSIVTSTMSSRPSRGSLTRKKSGGLRATLKRVFGSKRQLQPINGIPRDIGYSDPGNLMSTDILHSEEPSHQTSYKRSQSLTRSITRSSALRSHAPGVPHQHLRTTEVAETSYPSKRRNTLPSIILSEQEAQTLSRSLSSHLDEVEKSSLQSPHVTSTSKRRSRSLEAILKEQRSRHADNQRQDRDSAIAYWRKSVLDDPLPTMPSTLYGEHEVEPDSDPGDPQLFRPPPTAIKPAQSFDFGLAVDDEPTSLEDRVNTLEVKLFDFEYAIAKLQGVELVKPTLQPRISRSKSSHDLLHRSSHYSTSTESSARKMLSFSRPRPLTGQSPEYDETSILEKSSRTETIRPSTSHVITSQRARSPTPSTIQITRGEYESLLAKVNDEKAARQQMELQIMNLQREVELMQTPIYAAISYPTPEKESPKEQSRSKTLHRAPHFEFVRTPPPSSSSNVLSRFSMDTETELQADDHHQECYETPNEKITFKIGRTSPLFSVPVA